MLILVLENRQLNSSYRQPLSVHRQPKTVRLDLLQFWLTILTIFSVISLA
jgi:hypothetical protein